MYKNQTAPDSGGSPPTSTNSDVAAADKEGVPLDEAVGKLLEGMDHLGNIKAHTTDVAQTVGRCSVRQKTVICREKLVGSLYFGPQRFPHFCYIVATAPILSQLKTGHTRTLYLRFILIISSHLSLDFPDVSSLHSFLTKIYAFTITPMRATLPTNPIFLALSTLKILLFELYKS